VGNFCFGNYGLVAGKKKGKNLVFHVLSFGKITL
jgi:hypothetical protein